MTMHGGSTDGTLVIPAELLPHLKTIPFGGNKMNIWMIWATVEDQPYAPWLVAAWDDESVSGNHNGWLEELAKAEEEYGARYIRVTKSSVNYDAVVNAFQPAEV